MPHRPVGTDARRIVERVMSADATKRDRRPKLDAIEQHVLEIARTERVAARRWRRSGPIVPGL